MAEYTLAPLVNPLFVLTPDDTDSTIVTYEASHRIFMWQRIDAGTWTLINLIEHASTSEQAELLERKGKIETPGLKAGQFVDFGMLPGGLDPNDDDFNQGRFFAFARIEVLFAAFPEVDFVDNVPDTGDTVGGTFYRKRMATSLATRFRLEISRDEPIAAPNGYMTLSNVIFRKNSDSAQLHDVEAVPLTPGTSYTAVIRLVDKKGFWQFFTVPFKTKRRKVTVQFKNFKVHNDSDDGAWGAGDDVEIWFRVYNGQNRVNEFKWGPTDITDEGSQSLVGLNFSDAVVGPDDLEGEDQGVGLGLYAREHDSFFWIPSTDEAEYREYYPDRTILRIKFPVGLGDEIVNPDTTATNLKISARPMNDDGSLHITTNVRYLVSYE